MKKRKHDKRKAKGKARPAKTRRKSLSRNPKAKGKRKKSLLAKVSRRKKFSSKGVYVRKVPVKKKPARKGRKFPRKKVRKPQLIIKKLGRTSKQIDYSFRYVRNIKTKVALFREHGGAPIDKMLKRRGGKPPKGIVVIVTDRKGGEIGKVSPFEMPVNANTIKEFTQSVIDGMVDDYAEWREMSKSKKLVEEDSEDNPYGDYNPNQITGIHIKFII